MVLKPKWDTSVAQRSETHSPMHAQDSSGSIRVVSTQWSTVKLTDWGAHHMDIATWGLGKTDTGPVTIDPVTARHPVKFRNGYPMDPSRYNTATEFLIRATFADGIERSTGTLARNRFWTTCKPRDSSLASTARVSRYHQAKHIAKHEDGSWGVKWEAMQDSALPRSFSWRRCERHRDMGIMSRACIQYFIVRVYTRRAICHP